MTVGEVVSVRSTDGVQVACSDLGGAGDDALLCHGTGFHAQVLGPLAAELTSLRCWAPDLRGHGATGEGTAVDCSGPRFADDVLAAARGLGLRAPIGIGHSKGGAALLLAEQRCPGTFRALWLYESAALPAGPDRDRCVARLARQARARRRGFPSVEAAVERLSRKPPMRAFDPAVLRAYVEHGFTSQPDGSISLRCTPEQEARIYESFYVGHDVFERLGEVGCPVLVVRGRVERHGPARFADMVADRLPDGRVEAHEDLDHFGPMVAPTRLAASIESFVAELDRT